MDIDYPKLATQVIKQAFTDAKGARSTVTRREANEARKFLTGNFSREMLEFYSECRGSSPNYIIKLAIQQEWADKYKPNYFKE